MNSKEIKTKILHYFRIHKRFYYLASEASRFESDILISNGTTIFEIEIKCSKSDLLADFKKKKHVTYKNPSKHYLSLMPNRFYFAVPPELTQDALNLVKDTKYGVIEVSEATLKVTKFIKYCKIVKEAENLKEGLSKKLLHKLLLRMGSELLRLRIKDHNAK